ncbi:arsenic resistance protein [Ornithinimicrobium pratense]|uniref:Arsenic resistance protein n=1 Tax=Ornithinimicrobium pratense TaxID=2593973 RepID=A0A5J6V364_9MICO|nr:arsenic resistance protein [Ornithinimicrobium pratense]QFG67736.1 arsenic resistance protein [Ornithinimicrobium pratense]
MTRERLERHQVWFYLAALVLGLLLGQVAPGLGPAAQASVWPALALLLYATFTQLPLTSVPKAFRDIRFLGTALVGNFVLVPLLVWGLVQLAPPDPALRLGLLLVLLVPCTDWFITFTRLGGGDGARATALTPFSLLLQLLLLPVYLWLLGGTPVTGVFTPGQVWPALLVLLGPLVLAALTLRWAGDRPRSRRLVERLEVAPVPLLAVVILLVGVSHADEIAGSGAVLRVVAGLAGLYLVGAVTLAVLLARLARLPVGQGRTLAFSLATRNSFIVLPFALTLPAGWETAALVVVLQSVVELLGMIVLVRLVPGVFFREVTPRRRAQAGS